MNTLVLHDELLERLHAYLDVPFERMAFLLAQHDSRPESTSWNATAELYLDDDIDYDHQDPFGMELADHVRPNVLQWATGTGAALVEMHAHGPSEFPTSFSPTDIEGMRQVVPQLLWRLSGPPYVAVVLGVDDLDAVVWERRGSRARSLAHVTLGDRTLTPTGIAEAELNAEEAQ